MSMEGRLLAPDNQVVQRSNAREPTQRAREAFSQPVDNGQCAPDGLQPLCIRCWTTRTGERKTAGEGRIMVWHEPCGPHRAPYWSSPGYYARRTTSLCKRTRSLHTSAFRVS